MNKTKTKIKIPKVMAFLFLTILTIIWLFPIIWTIFSSFKSGIEIIKSGYRFAPIEWVVDNYIIILKSKTAPMVRWFFNSMFISVTHTIFMLIIASLSGYAFARLEFKGEIQFFG